MTKNQRNNIIKERIDIETVAKNEPINHPHDKIIRKILEDKEEAVIVINMALKREDKITAEEIELYNSSFVTKELKNLESDIIYKVKDENVYFIIEHQTKIDYDMPYRILKYEIAIMNNVRKNEKYIGKTYEYPLIIAIVLYTGRQKWNAKLELTQHKWEKYKNEGISSYKVVDVNKISNKELRQGNSKIKETMYIEKAKTEKELIRFIKESYIKAKEKNDNEHIIFLIKILRVLLTGKITKKEIEEMLKEIEKGDEEMLASVEMLRQTTKDARKEGFKLR